MSKLKLKTLSLGDLDLIIPLVQQLNPHLDIEIMKERQTTMFGITNYHSFGFYKDKELVGLCSGWITVRIYSGKQLEIDNVIIDSNCQSKGLGKQFIQLIEDWAAACDCNSVELNAYLNNTRGHKFYHNQGYEILGFHYRKKIII